MKYLRISPRLPDISVLALGTAEFGTVVSKSDAFRLLDRYAEAGGNIVDTAHVYASWLPNGEGASERTVGEWLAKTKKDMVISTKGGHPDMNDLETPRLTPDTITSDLDESLERLQVSRIDIYWLHRDNESIPVGELLSALNDEVLKGRVAALGASNWRPSRIREAQKYAEKNNLTPFSASQIGWSFAQANASMQGTMGGLVYMDEENERHYAESWMPIFAYTSQGAGYFSGKYDVAGASSPDDGKAWFLHQLYQNPENEGRLARLRDLAKEKECQPTQLALAWLLQQGLPCVALIGPKSLPHLDESLISNELRLSDGELRWLADGEDLHLNDKFQQKTTNRSTL